MRRRASCCLRGSRPLLSRQGSYWARAGPCRTCAITWRGTPWEFSSGLDAPLELIVFGRRLLQPNAKHDYIPQHDIDDGPMDHEHKDDNVNLAADGPPQKSKKKVLQCAGWHYSTSLGVLSIARPSESPGAHTNHTSHTSTPNPNAYVATINTPPQLRITLQNVGSEDI